MCIIPSVWYRVLALLNLTFVIGCQSNDRRIDRYDLVSRHNVVIHKADTMSSLTVGNGQFAFTVDASGLQSFPSEYERGIPLGTQSQWGWHTQPSQTPYHLQDVYEMFTNGHRKVPYAIGHQKGFQKKATDWLGANPHRLHLGLIGLTIKKADGDLVKLSDLEEVNQVLNLYEGKIVTTYEIEGQPIKIELVAHPHHDGIAAQISTALVNRLQVSIRFPYGNPCHTCPGYDFNHPALHQTTVAHKKNNHVMLKRKLDHDVYFVHIQTQDAQFDAREKQHEFTITPIENKFSFSISFGQTNRTPVDDYATTEEQSRKAWEHFWETGGAIDFSHCQDPRAHELERRVILSQYLTRVQCAGSFPPQETGLTKNSWYGKFHLEMHWWHGTHFALWNRINLLERSLSWYSKIFSTASQTARVQGYDGLRWPKMTDPSGRESPSGIGAFLIWQQPHFIYFAELFYRQNPDLYLPRFKMLVDKTAEFMASYVTWDNKTQRFNLTDPLIPAQEVFGPLNIQNPPFEIAYWHYGLNTAQTWRRRTGLPPNKNWQNIINHLADLPHQHGRYLSIENAEKYEASVITRDHPIVLGPIGMLPWNRIDSIMATNTLQYVMENWNWQSTWGWDYPMAAMAAARVGQPELAVELLLKQDQKNTYLINGHNYQNKDLTLYLPGNGGLLTAVAMMAAGWDGSQVDAPGFPKNNQWDIRWEDLQKMP